MIIEARARKYDPVHGLAGIVETLLQQLNNLTSKLAFMNQQNQFHRRNSVRLQPHFRSNEAKGASSSPLRAAVPSPSLQDTGSSLTVSLSLSHLYCQQDIFLQLLMFDKIDFLYCLFL
ncbi:hypothetical protein MKW98_019881 [Papaver atlanticum]|uniref:Uncharacterized protein n=1 Tax=Papaver atlanticum TaxID=357466 RepID=A0AAD4X7A6_9MAGN|nr:hypothetical protein MKW98_019881 [Papaver atlanticum]